MKKLILIILFSFSSLNFSADFADINTFSVNVKEKSIINKKEKNKEYFLSVKFPDKIYKEMKKPEINKGELYIYNGNKKTIYIPALKQKSTKEIEEDENFIIKVMKDMRNINFSKAKNGMIETKESKYKVDSAARKVTEAEYDDGTKVVFENYKNILGYNFPLKVIIYDNGAFVSQLEFSNVQINLNVNDEIFILK